MNRHTLLIALAIVIAALTALGTMLWIAGIARPAPVVPPGRIVARIDRPPVLALTVEIGGGAAAFDRAGATVAALARAAATGRLATHDGITLLRIDFRNHGRPVMALAYDPGVLAAGAVSDATGDHMLGLAGQGSRWPARSDPGLIAYCGRMETGGKPFCTAAMG